ncbi:MAG: ion channel, partial [Pacificimonas sp.]
MIAALGITLFLVTATSIIHFRVLRACYHLVMHDQLRVKRPMLVVIAAVFAAHLLEVFLYALGYLVMEVWLGVGSLVGTSRNGETDALFDFFYFSIASYTTLGIGDIVPQGPMRLLTGIESLHGLVLIAWSSSFT